MTDEERQASIRESKRKYAAKVKGKYKTLSITQTAEQTEADRETLKRHNTTVLKVWRKAVDELDTKI